MAPSLRLTPFNAPWLRGSVARATETERPVTGRQYEYEYRAKLESKESTPYSVHKATIGD